MSPTFSGTLRLIFENARTNGDQRNMQRRSQRTCRLVTQPAILVGLRHLLSALPGGDS